MKIYCYKKWRNEIEISEAECEEKEKVYKVIKRGYGFGCRMIRKADIDVLDNYSQMVSLSKDNVELYKKLLIEKDGKIECRFVVDGKRYSCYADNVKECREKTKWAESASL